MRNRQILSKNDICLTTKVDEVDPTLPTRLQQTATKKRSGVVPPLGEMTYHQDKQDVWPSICFPIVLGEK